MGSEIGQKLAAHNGAAVCRHALEGFRRAPSGVAGEKEPTRQHEQGAGGRRAVMKRSGGLNPEPGGIGGVKGPPIWGPGPPPHLGYRAAPPPPPPQPNPKSPAPPPRKPGTNGEA